MLELLPQIENWIDNKKTFAIATVTKTWGSSPRPVGSSLIVNKDMEMAGSVSGGCVEGAVIKAAMPILESGQPGVLPFGVTDEDAWSVGLSCGGKMEVFAEKFIAFNEDQTERAVWQNLLQCLKENTGCTLISKMTAPKGKHMLVLGDGTVVGDPSDQNLISEAKRAYSERKNQVVSVGEENYFAQVFPRKSQMIIVGAAHITTDLVALGNLYDFETIVIDPRGIFAEKTQFPDPPHQLYVKWPAEVLPQFVLDEYSYAVLLTHDPKIDDQALDILLQSDIGYIGALGSRRTHEKRKVRLEKAGFTTQQIERIHGPIGVAINAKRPKEIALSIMGEIIKVQNQFH